MSGATGSSLPVRTAAGHCGFSASLSNEARTGGQNHPVRRRSPDPAVRLTAGLSTLGDLQSSPVARSGDRPQRRGQKMSWTIFFAILIPGVLHVALLNARPMRCAHCQKINVFRRRKTGQRREQRDHEDILFRTATEFTCDRCRRNYWIVWDDYKGRWAAPSERALDDQ